MKILQLLLAIVTLSLPIFVNAQSDEMIAFRDGDLVVWSLSNNVPEQITFWGYNGGGLLSPDGAMIAFLSIDGATGDAINRGDIYTEFGDLPSNIWVMDIASREFQWINDQTGATPDGGIYRSYPVWSPDGTQLAWTELNQFPDSSIKVYDFNTEAITTVASNFSLGYQDAGLIMPKIKWGDGGISRIVYNIVGEDFTVQQVLEVYDPNTGQVSTVDLAFLDPDGSASVSHQWVNDNGTDVLTVQVNNQWGTIDPQTGSYTPLPSPPVLQKVGDGTLQLIPAYTGSYSFEWYINNGGIVTQLGFNTFSIEGANYPTISPNGNVVAWNNAEDGIYIWTTDSQVSQKIIELTPYLSYERPSPANAVWSPMEWVLSDVPIVIQVRPTDSPTIIPPTQAPQPTAIPQQTNNCKTATYLFPDSYAILSPGENNNVRQSWSTDSAILGEIYPGEIVYVQDGPVCAEGINWWLVSNEFIYGWTAEGFNGAYWLVPWN